MLVETALLLRMYPGMNLSLSRQRCGAIQAWLGEFPDAAFAEDDNSRLPPIKSNARLRPSFVLVVKTRPHSRGNLPVILGVSLSMLGTRIIS